MDALTALGGWLMAVPLVALVATVLWVRGRRRAHVRSADAPAPLAPPPPLRRAGPSAESTAGSSSESSKVLQSASGQAADAVFAHQPDWAATVLVLPDFRPVRGQALSPQQQRHLLDAHAALPRPPRLMDQLLSPAFINDASARQLADLVAGEPLLAARVLKVVNSPFYGLSQPVNSIAQAVTYLGLTTVRITCLRYIFIAAFNTRDPQRQQAIDRLWRASALASELMRRAASELQLADAPRWASAVLLSFLGRLAVLASAPLEHLPALCAASPGQRAEAEQQQLGLCAAELGRLLMTHWELPASVVNDAADIEWLLFEAPPWPADGREEALALCALCVRLSERAVASDPHPPEPVLDGAHDDTIDWPGLRVRMGEARRVQVQAWLATPEVTHLLRGPAASAPVAGP